MKAEARIRIERLKNYVSNGSIQATKSLYVSVFLVSCRPLLQCFIYVIAKIFRYITSD